MRFRIRPLQLLLLSLLVPFAVVLMGKTQCQKVVPTEPICEDPSIDCAGMSPGDCEGGWTCNDLATCEWKCKGGGGNECQSNVDCAKGESCVCDGPCKFSADASNKLVPCFPTCTCKSNDPVPAGDCMSDFDCAPDQKCTAGTDCFACKSCPACAVCCGVCTGGTAPTTCKPTGCSGEICAAEPMASICIWKPEFECLKLDKCGNYGANGTCGWQNTPEYQQCVAATKM